MKRLPPVAVMYDALCRRDAGFEGVFVACVRSTGIFCRPTCSARKPLVKNVEFAASWQEALARGFRPCRVCRPLGPLDSEPTWLPPLLAEVFTTPSVRLSDADLRERGLEPVHVRRIFKRRYGMTFQAYQRASRLGTALGALQQGTHTLNAGLDAGFQSDSGFRDAFQRLFGATPGRGRDTALLVADWMATPLGPMLAVAAGDALALLEFVDRRALQTELLSLRRRLGAPIVPGKREILTAAATQLREYFEGARRQFDIPITQRGPDLDRRVWRALCDIPYGETRSYHELADGIGYAGASRAVGASNGRNQLAIIVPCHRVIRSDGNLSGYGGSRWRKRWLLDHESRHRELGIPDRRSPGDMVANDRSERSTS
jgi:AraC family transcriptional regulator, regulatory protein of adaptative response / methylated-DNA-[protein]-cysteine methyltransferase